MISADLLGDEGIALRQQAIHRGIERARSGGVGSGLDDTTIAMVVALVWQTSSPNLDRLAADRETRLARLYERGIQPAAECTTTGPVHLRALPGTGPLRHRAYIIRNDETQIGLAHLVTESQWIEPGCWEIATDTGKERFWGTTLPEALQRLADFIATREAGEIQ